MEKKISNDWLSRREFIKKSAVAGVGAMVGSSLLRGTPAFAKDKPEIIRCWGEPGPYAGVAVDGMNEWAAKNISQKFTIENLGWGDVYIKLMTDISAGQPPNLISVESPIAFQLMAEGLLEPVDDLVDRIGRDRLAGGAKWEYWGGWKGKQYIIPAHHQSHLLVVRMDIIKELGLSDPNTWDWYDFLNAAKTITEKKKPKMYGIVLALGRNLCTAYHFASFLHSAGGKMFDSQNKFEVVFNSPATVEALEFIKELYEFMPKGAVGYSFLECVDSIVMGQSAMTYYWGRVYGRSAKEAPEIFNNIESFLQPKHPKTGLRLNWNDFQGWAIPKQANPFIEEAKEALVYYQTKPEWLVRYCHSLMPNVSPVYKDVIDNPALYEHPFFETHKKTIMTYYVEALKNASNTGNELLKGINPLAGIVHGRLILAQTVQKTVLDNWSGKKAAEWGQAQLESIRKEHFRLVI